MADMVQGKPGAVVSNDIRLAAAALLVASDGEVLGQATVLSSDLAVTTAEVAQYASAKVAGLGNAPSSAFGPLAITFPQFRGAPGVYPLRATIEAIDAGRGFAIIRFSGMLPGPLPTGLLGAGDLPGIGSACDIFYSDPSWSAFYQIAGRLETLEGARFRVSLTDALDEPLATALAAAPVFVGSWFLGIVVTAVPGLAEVLSVDGMALSRVTPAVRSLLPWIDPSRSATLTSVPNSAEAVNLPDAGLFARLSVSSRAVLGRAEAIRIWGHQDKIHMEQLIAALFDKKGGPTQRLFANAKIDRERLVRVIQETVGTGIPAVYEATELTSLPGLSGHVADALTAAATVAAAPGLIRSRHLLYGAVSVNQCAMIRALTKLGVNRDGIVLDDEADVDEGGVSDPHGDRPDALPTTVAPPGPADELEAADIQSGEDEGPKRVKERVEDLLPRFSDSAWNAMERAAALRMGQTMIHLEQLIAGLFEDWKVFFSKCGVDGVGFRQIIREETNIIVPQEYQPEKWRDRVRPLSGNVRQTVLNAGRLADRSGSEQVFSVHLLYGALSQQESDLVRALLRRGIRREEILLQDGPDPDAPFFPGGRMLPGSANPTPKVDSDLWSDEDKLGYEAYARTIASLITHQDTVAPLTIGIKAPWGAGKTSLMKRVQHLLDGYAELSEEGRTGILQEWQPPQTTLGELLDQLKTSSKPNKLEVKRSKKGEAYGLPPRTTVWFNAWKYQTSEQIWAGMAHCIISQVTARMAVKEREWFWVRLHARRLNVEEIRKKIHGILLRKLIPTALLVVTVCVIAFWIAAALPLVPWWWRGVLRGVPVIWGVYRLNKGRAEKLGEKAADTMRNLMREPDYEGKMGYLHLVESDMREVLQLATEGSVTKEKPSGDPLVVFVDDLDRCAPNKVAEVVEAINLFLCGDYPNCIFVLGMEPGMVAAALEVANKDVIEKAVEMGLMDRTAPVGWRFMEKIVQLPITIPPPTPRGRDSYVESLVGSFKVGPAEVGRSEPVAPVEAAAPKEEEVREFIQQMQGSSLAEVEEKSLKVVAAASPEKKRAAAEAGKRVYANTFSERDPAIAEFVQEVAELVDGNPRQIKRYVNVFRFYSTLRYGLRADGSVAASDFPTDKVLAKFVALNIQWPHAVDCLRVKRDLGAKGEAMSRLQFLEEESARITGEACDEEWKKAVDKSGAGSFAAASSFREFLKKGESLGKSLGQGLW